MAPMKKQYRKLVNFEANDKSLKKKKKKKKKKKAMELLEKHWNQCITLEGDYVDE